MNKKLQSLLVATLGLFAFTAVGCGGEEDTTVGDEVEETEETMEEGAQDMGDEMNEMGEDMEEGMNDAAESADDAADDMLGDN